MGANHSVHMANASGQQILIFVGLNPKWAILDFFFDTTLMVLGAGNIRKLALEVAEFKNYQVPTRLETLQDLYQYTLAAAIMLATGANIPMVAPSIQGFYDSIRKTAVSISHNTFKNINERNLLQIYLNPSGYAGLMGAKTVTVYVMSMDGKQVALYNTGPDHSWIATANQTIVRSRYGTIWQQDPSAGSHAWPLIRSNIGDIGFDFDTAVPLPLPIQGLSAVDGVVDATDGAAGAEGAVDSNVDVASGAAGGEDGKVDEADDLAGAANGKVATSDEADPAAADGTMPVDDGANSAARGV